MQMHQVRYFSSLCACENFTRAAEICHVSQPALTRAIRDLEAELGGKLFHRGHTRSRLTAFGQSMRPFLEQIERYAKAARIAAASWRRGEVGLLRIGVVPTVSMARFAACIADFRRRHPGVTVELREAEEATFAPSLARGDFEMALVTAPRELDRGLVLQTLYADSLVVAVPAGHRFECQDIVTPADCGGETLIEGPTSQAHFALCPTGDAGQPPCDIACRLARDEWLPALVAAGIGIAILPRDAALAPGVIARPLLAPLFTRSVALAISTELALSPAALALLDCVGTIPERREAA